MIDGFGARFWHVLGDIREIRRTVSTISLDVIYGKIWCNMSDYYEWLDTSHTDG